MLKHRHEDYHKSPAVGVCEACGRHIELGAFTNTCACGADYNGSGQRLAPREQWGEDTGEHPSDCVGPFREED